MHVWLCDSCMVLEQVILDFSSLYFGWIIFVSHQNSQFQVLMLPLIQYLLSILKSLWSIGYYRLSSCPFVFIYCTNIYIYLHIYVDTLIKYLLTACTSHLPASLMYTDAHAEEAHTLVGVWESDQGGHDFLWLTLPSQLSFKSRFKTYLYSVELISL